MNTSESLQTVLEYLPARIKNQILQMPDEIKAHVQEIRLRCHRPAGIVIHGKEQILYPEMIIHTEEINRSFQAVCSYSVYSYEQELSEGYITIRGGCRVGICGSAVRHGQHIQSLKYISSLNFRIAGEFSGIAENLRQQTGNSSILITGSVGSGKTTYLRDICRLTGNQYRTALIDERGELAAVQKGRPSHDIGIMTDVLDGYPRAAGILTALRVMSPEYIICDEISTQEDVEAILQAAGCGIRFAASCHAGSPDDLRKRPALKKLLDADIFQYSIFLQNGMVQHIRKLKSAS